MVVKAVTASSADLRHTIVMGIFDGRPCFICIRCGCFAVARTEGLNSRCKPPTRNGKYALSRFFRGMHPDQRKGTAKNCEAFFRVLATELQEFTPQG